MCAMPSDDVMVKALQQLCESRWQCSQSSEISGKTITMPSIIASRNILRAHCETTTKSFAAQLHTCKPRGTYLKIAEL